MAKSLEELGFLARQKGRSGGQYHRGQRINVRQVVDLLQAGAQRQRHTAIRQASRALLVLMSQTSWVVSAGPHQGGSGGRGQGPDSTNHITIRIRHSYHLRLDQRGHLFQITGPNMPSHKPWVAPGSAPSET